MMLENNEDLDVSYNQEENYGDELRGLEDQNREESSYDSEEAEDVVVDQDSIDLN